MRNYIAALFLVVLVAACASPPSKWDKEGVRKNADKAHEELKKEESNR